MDVLRFWLDKGVDGFRVDVMWHMIKDDQFRDNPPNPDYTEEQSPYEKLLQTYTTDQPEVHKIVRMMRSVLDMYDQRLLIGEIYLPIEKLVTYYGVNNKGAHLPFNFQLLVLPWDAEKIQAAINEYEGALPAGGWPNWVLGNHDKSRIATRVGREQARIAAMLLLTLRGTPTIYYGDELGMEDVEIAPEDVQDPQEKNIPGIGLGRDPERTPMQWDDSKYAGFSKSEPWLPLMENYKEVNVKIEKEQEDSMFTYHQKLIKLRQSEAALNVGDYVPVYTEGNLLSYIRTSGDKKFLVILNLGKSEEKFQPDIPAWKGEVKISANSARTGNKLQNKVDLEPNEGLVVLLNNN